MISRLLTLLYFLVLVLFSFHINSPDTSAQTNDYINLQLVAEYQLGFANYQDSFWFNHDGSVVAIHLGEAIEFIDMQTLETLGLLQLTLRNAPNEAEIQREMVTSAGFISDGHFVVGISAGNPFRDFGQLLLWNVLEMSELEPLETMASIENISTSLNGGYLAYTYKVFDVILENAITGEILYTTQVDGRFGGSPIFSPTENLFVVLQGGDIQLIEPETNTINAIKPNHIPYDLTFSPSGNLLASHSETSIEIWGVSTLEAFTTLHFSEADFIADIDISSDENLIAIAGSQLRPEINLIIIDFEKSEEILATNIYTDSVFTVAFHPSLPILVSGGRDGTLRLWDVGISDNPTFEFFMDGAVVNLAFSPDGHYLFAQTTSELMIWEMDS